MNFSLAQLEAIFCDDVRTEDNGKKLLIGVYENLMLFTSFPASLPRLIVTLSLFMTSDRVPAQSLRFVILKDEEVFAEAEIPYEQAKDALEQARSKTEDGSLSKLRAEFIFSPFQVEAGCRIRPRAYIDGVELRAPGLLIQDAEGI
jgi:hypothetical protein